MARALALRLLGALAALFPATLAVAAPEAYLRLEQLAPRYGLKATRSDRDATLRLQNARTTLEFTAGSREVSWNGYRLFLGEPVELRRRALHLSPVDWSAIVRPLVDARAVPAPGPLRTVMIDAGHGGSDPGTENRALRLQEKTFTLDVAQRLKRDLERRGYRVLMTRTRDTRLKPDQAEDLRARAEKANRAGADLFVSLHFNSLPASPAVHGVETYVLTPATQRSTAVPERTAADRIRHPGNRHDHWNAVLGGAVHHRLVRGLPAFDRGVKRARFAVLRSIDCPAVLVEGGFLSNTAEARKIRTPAYRQKLAEAIGAGIGDYHVLLRAATKGKNS